MTQVANDNVRMGLAEIWTATLGTEPRDDDDFFESGGGSMEMIMLMVAVQERFGISISIDEIFHDSFTFCDGVKGIERAAPR